MGENNAEVQDAIEFAKRESQDAREFAEEWHEEVLAAETEKEKENAAKKEDVREGTDS